MAKITVTAGNGVRAKASISALEVQKTEVPAVKDSDGNILIPAHVDEFRSWVDVNIVTFASEAREFDLQAGERLVVVENRD